MAPQSTVIYIEGKETRVHAVNLGKAGERHQPVLVDENHRSLDQVNIYSSRIKHLKPIQYFLIISPF